MRLDEPSADLPLYDIHAQRAGTQVLKYTIYDLNWRDNHVVREETFRYSKFASLVAEFDKDTLGEID